MSNDKPTRPPPIRLMKGSGETFPYKRRTPSAPMAAVSPEAYSVSDDIEMEQEPARVLLNEATRDELLLKVISRVERIDTEHELVIEAIKAHSAKLDALQRDQRVIAGDVKTLVTNMGTVKGLLTDILTKLS